MNAVGVGDADTKDKEHSLDTSLEDIKKKTKHPTNLKGLLRFAMEATKSEDTTKPSNFQEMDPERREFLEKVMKSMTIDIVQQLEKAAAALENKNSKESELLDALDVILDYVDNIDSANDFCKVGGLNVLLPHLKSAYVAVRSMAASVVAELAQNNPFCQMHLANGNVIQDLCDLLCNNETAASGIYAISCTIRGCEISLNKFIDLNGLQMIIDSIKQDKPERCIIKSLFLMNALCSESNIIKEKFIELNAIENILPLVVPKDDYDIKLETSLAVLNVLIGIKDKRQSIIDLNLLNTIDSVLLMANDKEQCQETILYCNELKRKFE